MRMRTGAAALLVLIAAFSPVPSASAAAEPCVAYINGYAFHGDIPFEQGISGLKVDAIPLEGPEVVLASTLTGNGGTYGVELPCSPSPVTLRVTDPTGFYGTTYYGRSLGYRDPESPIYIFGPWTSAGPTMLHLERPARFVPVEPHRVLDTRSTGGPLDPGAARRFDLPDLPPDATSVVLNLTATEGTSSTSFISEVPQWSAEVPRTSVLNSAFRRDVANLVTLRLNTQDDKFVVLYNNAGQTHLVADIAGYYSPAGGAGLTPVSPTRVLDTRDSAALGPGSIRTLKLDNAPANAVAVAITLTSTEVTAATTYVSAYPTDATDGPATSVLNAYRGDDIPNQAIVPLGPDGAITLYNDQGTTHLIADVVGWFVEAGGAYYHPLEPRRAVGSGVLEPGASRAFTAGTAQLAVPDAAVAVAMNLTTAGATQPSFLTVYPTGTERPWASNANARPGSDTATAAFARLGPGFTVYNDRGSVLTLVDVFGYFANHG